MTTWDRFRTWGREFTNVGSKFRFLKILPMGWRVSVFEWGPRLWRGRGATPYPCSWLLLVRVDVADGDGRKIQLLEVDLDGDRDGVEGGDEEGTLPENKGHGRQREENPEQAPQAAAGHHDAAAAVGVGVEAVPPHQLFDGRCLGPRHGQILLDFGFDLLSGSHGEDGTWRARQAGGAEKKSG